MVTTIQTWITVITEHNRGIQRHPLTIMMTTFDKLQNQKITGNVSLTS